MPILFQHSAILLVGNQIAFSGQDESRKCCCCICEGRRTEATLRFQISGIIAREPPECWDCGALNGDYVFNLGDYPLQSDNGRCWHEGTLENVSQACQTTWDAHFLLEEVIGWTRKVRFELKPADFAGTIWEMVGFVPPFPCDWFDEYPIDMIEAEPNYCDWSGAHTCLLSSWPP